MTGLDWIVAAGLTLFLALVVVVSRRFTKDVSSFIVGGRKTRMWLALSNNNSGGLGLIAIAYMSQEGFRHGFSITWITLIGSVAVVVLFGIFGFGIQRFRASRSMTAGQYHEMRYSRGVRLLVGIGLSIAGVLGMAIFPVVGAQFLCAFLGWPMNFDFMGMTLPTIPVLTAGMIALAVFFAVVCGQVGVIVSDYVQGIIIMGGLFAANWIIYRNLGIANIKATLGMEKGIGAFNPFVLGSYGLIWIMWKVVSTVSSPFCSAPHMTKFASADNPKVVRMMLLISHTFGQGKQLLMISLGAGAFVAMGAGAVPEGMDTNLYERIVTPMYLNTIVPPILAGLLLSAFMFAFISTHDTYLLSWASVIVNDVICLIKKKPMSTKGHLRALRIAIICIGIFLYLWGVLYEIPSTILNYLLMTATMFLGSAVALVAGLYWRRANTAGAYAAVLTTIILPILDLILRKTHPSTYTISPQVVGTITVAASGLLLVVFSLVSNKPTKFVDYGKAVRQSEAND